MKVGKELKGKAGIYAIECLANKRFYIGSSNDVYRRLMQHSLDLRKICHHSPKLQQAWNKYGQDKFICFLLEEIEDRKDTDFIRGREQIWINELKAFKKGFNVNPFVDGFGSGQDSLCATPYRLVDPEGNVREGKNIAELAREIGVIESGLHAVLTGRRNSCKGWTLTGKELQKKNAKWKPYAFESPDGVIYRGNNIHEFARQQGLHGSALNDLMTGKRSHYKGWIKEGGTRPIKDVKTYTFISPSGEVFATTKPRQFAIQRGLDPACFHRMWTGKAKQCKGWHLPDADLSNCYQPIQYAFIDPDGYLHEGVNIGRFAKIHGLHPGAMLELHHGTMGCYKGWTALNSKYKSRMEERCKEFELQSPDGIIHKGVNIKAFAKEHGLNAAHLCQVVKGSKLQYKGWTLPGVEKPSKRVARFRHPVTGEILETTTIEGFAREHGLTAVALRLVYRGKYRHHKGWTKA